MKSYRYGWTLRRRVLTLLTVALDRREAAVRLAGHPPPLLLSSGSVVTVPTHHGPVLGVFDDAQRPASRFSLTGSDWALLLYTDGLIEGRTGADDRRMDITGLHTLIAKAQAEQVTHDRLPRWLAGRAEQANDGPLADDVAMLLLTTAEADTHTTAEADM